MSGRRRRTTSTTNPPAKPAAASKPVAQTAKPVASSSSKPTTTAQPKPTPPPPAKLTPSARLRQEWKSFETWLAARRAERDKRMNEKLKEIMSSKGKSKWGKPVATNDADVGAFEDRLNEELAEQARLEWVKRVAATGLEEEDWTDITEKEMLAVEAAFVPQARAAQPVAANPPPSVPASATSSKTTVGGKPGNIRNPYAATVEEEPALPGAWEVPSQSSVPARGMTSRTSAQTPIITRVIPTPNGVRVDQPKSSGSMPTPESLWEMHMTKRSVPQEPEPSENFCDTQANTARSGDSPQSFGSRWSPFGSTPPTSAPSSKLPTPELLWEINGNRSSPKQALPPATSSAFPLTDKLMGHSTDPFPVYPDPEPESIWEARAQKKNGANSQRPTSVKPPLSVPPVSRTPAPTRTPIPIKAPAPSKPLAPSKLSMSVSNDEWNTPATLGHPSLHHTASELITPVSSTFAGNYNYISPVFLEMEDDEFPRQDDPLPESTVEETIWEFHKTAADMEIELRRDILSGKFDDGALEQLLSSHITTMERNARKVLDKWDGARDAVIEERRAEEQRQRMLEESRRRQTEAKKLAGKKKGKWSLPIIEDVPEEPPVVEPPVQSKKKLAKKGVAKSQQAVVEESFRAKAATPSFPPDDEDDGNNFWQAHPKAAPQAAAAKSMFSSFFVKPSPSPAPGPPVPTPWPQSQMVPPTKASQPKNPFAPTSRATNVAPEPPKTPWEAMVARKQETAPVLQQQPDPWADDNTDESEEGASWTEAAMNTARGGVASAWDIAMSAIGGERSGTAAARPAMPPATERESVWGGGDKFARSVSRAAWAEESSSGADPRFSTWTPPRRAEPVGSDNNATKMADLAFENLFEIADVGEDPADLINAMSMFSKANSMASSTRKRGGSNAYR